VHVASRALARALGTAHVEAHHWPLGLLPAEGVRRGVPSAEMEVGGLGRDTAEGRAVIVRAVAGFLAHTRIGRQREAGGGPVEVARTTFATPVRGLVRHLVPLGAPVEAGRSCAEIRSIRGEVEAEFAPPRDGIVGIRFRFGWVEESTPVVAVFHREG
jgi:predicted deacylase